MFAFLHAHVSCVYALNHVSSQIQRDYYLLTFEAYAFHLRNLISMITEFLDAGRIFLPLIRAIHAVWLFSVQ